MADASETNHGELGNESDKERSGTPQGKVGPADGKDQGKDEGKVTLSTIPEDLLKLHPDLTDLATDLKTFSGQSDHAAKESYKADKSSVRHQADDNARCMRLLPVIPEKDPEDMKDMEENGLQALCMLHKNLKQQVKENREFFGANGQSLYSGLESIVTMYSIGPFGKEDHFMKELIDNFVAKVFNGIQQDSANHALLMNNYKERIDLLTRKAEKCSSHLGEDTLVPDRFNLEQQRTQQVQQLVQLHDQRVQAVNTPSKVPELLEESLKVFNSKNDEQQSDLRERAKRHNECVVASKTLKSQQEAYKRWKLANSKQEEQQANNLRNDKEQELRHVVQELKQKLAQVMRLVAEIREQTVRADGKAYEQVVTNELMNQAMLEQEAQEKWHKQLCHRYERGAELLGEFGSWLKMSYAWMEKTLEDKRAALKQELPAEKDRIDSLLAELEKDLQRRIKEQLWAMEETRNKRDKYGRDAARLERIKGKKLQAQTKKQQVEEMDKELQDMQEEYDKLNTMFEEVSKRSTNPAPRNSSALGWVSSFFYNNEPPQKRYLPPALENIGSANCYLTNSVTPMEANGSKGSSCRSAWKRIADYVVPGRKRKHGKSCPDEIDSQYLGSKRRAIDQPLVQVSYPQQAPAQFQKAPQSGELQRAITWTP